MVLLLVLAAALIAGFVCLTGLVVGIFAVVAKVVFCLLLLGFAILLFSRSGTDEYPNDL